MIYEKIRVINGNPINIDGYNILITISIIINIAPNKILPFLNNILKLRTLKCAYAP